MELYMNLEQKLHIRFISYLNFINRVPCIAFFYLCENIILAYKNIKSLRIEYSFQIESTVKCDYILYIYGRFPGYSRTTKYVPENSWYF